jgi:hypothetical protein
MEPPPSDGSPSSPPGRGSGSGGRGAGIRLEVAAKPSEKTTRCPFISPTRRAEKDKAPRNAGVANGGSEAARAGARPLEQVGSIHQNQTIKEKAFEGGRVWALGFGPEGAGQAGRTSRGAKPPSTGVRYRTTIARGKN